MMASKGIFRGFGGVIDKRGSMMTMGSRTIITGSSLLLNGSASAGRIGLYSSLVPRLAMCRPVHDTKKKDSTTLVTSDKNSMAFHKMSLKALKNECRSRGLKVSGRKAELVSRVIANQSLNEIMINKAKKPANSTKKRTIYTAAPTNLSQTIPETIAEPLARSKLNEISAKQSEKNEVLKALKNKIAFETETTVFDHTNNVTHKTSNGQKTTFQVQSELQTRDRVFFYGFTAVVGLWWGLLYIDDKK